MTMDTCACKTTQPRRGALLEEFCIKCGRIWMNTLCGWMRKTDRFHDLPGPPLGGVWVGHTFFKGATLR